ncbi:Class I SAM-dependent methyltransferase [Tenacibaculum sp. 190130A14a]|uniref:Class I SAM-dependent methyltransferase n=1 Tax=Tenacibaculum polynesiense TaxID=3137857 RepID=A0ABP1EYS0_9FLAO
MNVKYDKIGKGYNQTRKADKYLTERLLFLLKPQPSKLYLDIGCGTGNYTNQFQQRGYSFIGIDPSETMLFKAKEKNNRIDWRIGTAENTQLNSDSIDGIIASLTIHHWKDINLAFRELFRVLKPNCKLVLFTSTQEQMQGYWLNEYFPKMLEDSINQMPKHEDILDALQSSGFKRNTSEKYFIKPDLEDKFLYCGKQNPQMYFNEAIRNGISSFSDLSNKTEIERGLQKLKRDIDTNQINAIINKYENDLGDYLFITAKK